MRVSRNDLGPLAALAFLAGLLFCIPPIVGRTFFWGDLTYLNFPWRTLTAEIVQRGALPLWNPYTYLGMPLAAQMQNGVWYPGSLPFFFFPFERSLGLYGAAHFFLAGALTFLWLRRLGLARLGALSGALLYMLGGGLVCRIPFLNHISTLAYFPGLLLAARSPALFALAASLAFFSGYPPMLAGEIVVALLAARWLTPRPARARRWLAAGALCLGLTACLLLPAAELALDSRRSEGLPAAEALHWSYSPGDLAQFTAPALIGSFSPARDWWKTSYLGFAGWLAVLAGLTCLSASALAAVAAFLGAVLLLILGATNPVSLWVWTHGGPLRYLRYPGNLSYLAAPMFAYLAALGAQRLRLLRTRLPLAALTAGMIALELFAYAVASQPLAPRGYFADTGPLVRRLRRDLGEHRYLISPLALNWTRGQGGDRDSAALDLKHRLYGATNMPSHLYSIANFGEPLVPRANEAFVDFLHSRSGLAELAPWLGWADAGMLFTRDLLKPRGLTYLGDVLWHIYRPEGPCARAFWFDEREGSLIPREIGGGLPDLRRGIPIDVLHEREDRYRISGTSASPGWLFISEPRSAGWQADAGTEPALTAFQKVRVPRGPWSLHFRYRPLGWRLGRALTLLVLLAASAYWYNSVFRRFTP